ncbi:MAG TPA: hypothetical protein VN364_08245 [Bellilinea sp.]|nr:hypothetical protein [Bellilinea sp.]
MVANAIASLQAQIVPVSEAINRLQARRPVSVSHAMDFLEHLAFYATAAGILHDLAPQLLINDMPLEELINRAVTQIDAVAPIMATMLGEFDESNILYPDTRGYGLGWDDWEQLQDDITSGDLSEGMRLYAFLTLLRLGSDDFTEISDRYGWGVHYVEFGRVDLERLKKLLDRAGLADFYDGLRVCWYCTGNIYFDLNPYDEGEIDPDVPPFTREGIEYLRQAWTDAQPILAAHNRAVERFAQEPLLAVKLLDCLMRSAERPRPAPRVISNQTLAQLWAGEPADENGNIDERIRVRTL